MKQYRKAAWFCSLAVWLLAGTVCACEQEQDRNADFFVQNSQQAMEQPALQKAQEGGNDIAGGEAQAGSEEENMKEKDCFRTEINNRTREDAQSECVDVLTFEQPSAAQVREWIEAYSMEGYPYLDQAAIQPQDQQQIMNRRNLEALTEPVNMVYGIITDNAAVRSFPTWKKLSKGLGERDFDYFQESMLLTGEPAVILHQTADQVWSFVQAGNYHGWIMTDHIGVCEKDELEAWIAPEACAVVTEPYVKADTKRLRMGTVLPARQEEDCLTVQLPQRDETGALCTAEVQVREEDGFHAGYLEMTQENILSQAKKLLGTAYGWGDSNIDMDCSSTMNTIYRCFGILLPRNTSALPHTGAKVYNMDGMGEEEKRALIESLAPGTMLVMNGHVVMYIGQEDGVSSILHNVVGFSLDGGKTVIDAYRCCITPLDVRTGSGTSYLERYRFAITLEEWYQE